jgi:2-polyprenyl-3-methyl-5-hydroxy-6-metoxy-1,4-benzoquinol methylase
VLPLPSSDELTRIYGSTYFERWLRDRELRAREGERFRQLFDLIGRDVPVGRLLSVGCGLGFDLKVAKDLGFDATGLESSEVAVRYAQDFVGVPVMHGTLETFSGADGSFDVVTFWDVLEHLPDPCGALARAASLLRPGGIVVVRTPNVRGLFPLVSFALHRLVGEWRHPEPPAHLYEFSPATFGRLAEHCGMKVRQVFHDEWPLDRLVAISRRPNVTRLLAGLLYPLARRLRMGNSMIVVVGKATMQRGENPATRPMGAFPRAELIR